MIVKDRILRRANNKPIVWDAYFKSDGLKKPIVIFCHGYKGFKDWGAWDLVAETFSEQHLFFIKFNFSYNGGTVENPIDFPDLEAFSNNNYTKELNDLDDVLNVILSKNFQFKNEINAKNITLIGHSRGGGISIIKASEDQRITKLITWASVSDFGNRFGSDEDINTWQEKGIKYVLNGRTQQQMPHKYQFYEDYIQNEERLSIKKAAESITVPQLIIHGLEDDAVAFSEAENLHSWNAESELYKIDKTNHVFGASHPWKEKTLPAKLNQVTQKSIAFIK